MKLNIRRELLSKINALTPSERENYSILIQNNLKKEMAEQTGVWVGYQALKDEPAINWQQAAPHITWAYPCLAENETSLCFKKAVSNYKRSHLGFSEPTDGENVALNEVSGVVMPALAFDHQGYRLGRGGGYYDRSFSQFKNKKIGVCFDLSLVPNLPNESHDVRCETIITEKQVYQVGSPKGEQKWN